MRRDVLEVLDHRMGGVRPELAGDAQHHRLRLLALELDLAFAQIGFDTVELAEEVVVPERPAVFAVGDGFESHRLLLLDDRLDLAVLDRLKLLGRDLVLFAPGPRLLQRGRAQQATDVVGAERRLGTLHCFLSTRSDRHPRVHLSRRTWIAGSSPAMTAVRVAASYSPTPHLI